MKPVPIDRTYHLRSLLEHLTDLLFRTWSAFLVAKHIDSVIDSETPIQNHYFFVSVQASCVETSLLGFSKLMSRGKSETSVTYLLKLCEQSPSAFPTLSQANGFQVIQGHRQQLANFQLLIGHVKLWRDRAIAHLDKKLVNNPSAVVQMQPVDMDALGEGFILLGDIINTYRKWLGLGTLRLEESETEMSKEWADLVGLVKTRKKPHQ